MACPVLCELGHESSALSEKAAIGKLYSHLPYAAALQHGYGPLQALAQDHAFVRVATGIYALRCIAGNVDFVDAPAVPKASDASPRKRKLDDPASSPGRAPAGDFRAAAQAASGAQHATSTAAMSAAANGAPGAVGASPHQIEAYKPAKPKVPRSSSAGTLALDLGDPSVKFAELVKDMAAHGSDEQQVSLQCMPMHPWQQHASLLSGCELSLRTVA